MDGVQILNPESIARPHGLGLALSRRLDSLPARILVDYRLAAPSFG